MDANLLYNHQILENIRKEIADVEADAKITRGCIFDKEVWKEFEALLSDPGYSWARLSQHLNTLDLAWNQKYLMGNALIEQGEDHKEILL